MTRPQPRYRKGDKIGGRYFVGDVKFGGMSEIYLCLDLEHDIPYALKTFHQRFATNPEFLDIFEQEVATWMALENHPNIVRCYWMDNLDDQPFMFLEWIDGEEGKGNDLRGWLRHGPMKPRVALNLAVDIIRGMIHVQEKQPGLVHRDLKPENILVSQEGLAKITDFGLAQIVERGELKIVETEAMAGGRQSIVCKAGISGTPAYMSPEQWRGESLDERTDIYAFGCILYEMLIGKPPYQISFPVTNPQWLQKMQRQHETEVIPFPAIGLSAVILELLQICLAKERQARPDSFNELLSYMEQIYQQEFGEPVQAPLTIDEFTARDHGNRGLAYLKLKRYEYALNDFNQVIKLNPNSAEAHTYRGTVYHDLEQYKVALSDFNQAIKLDSGLELAFLNRGINYLSMGQNENARKDFDQAIDLRPNFVLAYYNRGILYFGLEQYEKVLNDCSRAIDLNPDFYQAFNNRGLAYAALQKYKQALDDYNQAINLDPNYASAYSNRGVTFSTLQKYEEALNDYNRAIELDPEDAQYYTNRGNAFHALRRYEQALDDHNQAVELDPHSARVYFNRGIVYFDMQHYQRAIDDFSQAIRTNPNYASAFVNRGNVFRSLQQYDQAINDFKQAITLDPKLTQAYFNLGAVLVSIDEYREALPFFEKAAELGDHKASHVIIEIRQMLDELPSSQVDWPPQAIEAFLQSESVEEIQDLVTHYPFLIERTFISTFEQGIIKNVPPEHRSAFERRVAVLRQIAREQNQ